VILPTDLGYLLWRCIGTSCGKSPDVVHRQRVRSMSRRRTEERAKLTFRITFRIPGSSVTRGIDPSKLATEKT